MKICFVFKLDNIVCTFARVHSLSGLYKKPKLLRVPCLNSLKLGSCSGVQVEN